MNNILETVKEISTKLTPANILISTAESCTGGLISKYLTDLSGSSKFYDCSIIAYSNESKSSLLNVDAATISNNGAVSEEVVKEMTKGLLSISRATIAVAVSGIMGPTSDNAQKANGSVWICIQSKPSLENPDSFTIDRQKTYFYQLAGNRDANRQETAKLAIINLYDFINEL